MKDQPGKVIGQIGQGQLCFGPGEPDGAYEQTEAAFLMGENVLDAGPDRRFSGIGPGGMFRHGFALRFAAVDLTVHHVLRQPFLVAL